MKTYIADIIPKIKQFSKELNDLTLLENQHWVIIDESTQAKQVFIFRKNSELLIATNGIVKKGKWEYLDNDSLLIEKEGSMFLLKHDFLDDDILSLKLDSQGESVFFVNETKYGEDLDDIVKISEFLRSKYLSSSRPSSTSSSHLSLGTPKISNVFVKSKVLNNGHIAPPAKRVHLLTITTSWFGLLDAYRINFQDDTFGFLYCTHQKDDHFIEYMHLPGSSERRRAWYGDFETTVSALHFYLTHKKLTQSGFIKDTSSWTSHDSYLLKNYGNGLEPD